jgi:hypothetical protein
VNGSLEAVFVSRGEIRKWRGAGSRGKKMCFGESKLDAKRFTEFGKSVKEKGMLA